jgi:hypothetical protein
MRTPSVADDLRLKPQTKTVLRHLKNHDHISPMKALGVYGISRLAACIYEIRKAGYDIRADFARDEAGHKYTKYSLAPAIH